MIAVGILRLRELMRARCAQDDKSKTTNAEDDKSNASLAEGAGKASVSLFASA